MANKSVSYEKYDSKYKWRKAYSVKMNDLEKLLIKVECYAEKNIPFIDDPDYADLLKLKVTTESLNQILLQLIHLVNIKQKLAGEL